MKLKTLDDLLLHELKDLLSAEKQLIKALPKMAKAAANEKLREAFETHLEQTKSQVDRLEKCFDYLGKTARAETCKAMAGLLEEGSDLIDEDAEPSVKDVALIGSAQRVEHYEIAAYGTCRTIAEQLGQKKVAELLQQTLDEEKETDELLTELATTVVNVEAKSA